MGKGGSQKAHLEQIVKICEEARAVIDGQLEIIKGALDAGRDDHGLDPGAVRRLLAWRRKNEKDPVKRASDDELDDQYRFMFEGGAAYDMPAKADTEIERVMALCSGDKPPKIEAIKKALGCSQGKAHKLRSLAVARLTAKSSSSRDEREHEQLLKRFETPKPPAATYTKAAPDIPPPPATEFGVGAGTVIGKDDDEKSCGGVESRHAGEMAAASTAHEQPTPQASAPPARLDTGLASGAAGVAPGPQDPLVAMEAAAERFEALKARAA